MDCPHYTPHCFVQKMFIVHPSSPFISHTTRTPLMPQNRRVPQDLVAVSGRRNAVRPMPKGTPGCQWHIQYVDSLAMTLAIFAMWPNEPLECGA